jgi:hypothetical protein
MANRSALLAVGFLYAAASVWLVHTEAESYRRSLQTRRGQAVVASTSKDDATAPPTGGAEPSERPQPDSPREAHGGQAASGASPKVRHPARAPAKRQPLKPKKADPKRVIASATPIPPTPEPPRPVPKPDVAPVKLKPLVIPGLDQATAADEAVFGQLLNKLILIDHPADEDAGRQRTILEATPPIIDVRDRKDVAITVTVLDSDEVNAFSHMGGYIYVTRGLLSFSATEEELRFVVGHELAHIDLKHGQALAAETLRDGRAAQVGSLQAMYHQIAAGYTEAQEFAADDWVIDRMRRLDQTTRECLMFLRKFRRLSEDLKFREGRTPPKSALSASDQDVANHYRSQPAAWKRLSRLETRLNATPARPGAVGPPG